MPDYTNSMPFDINLDKDTPQFTSIVTTIEAEVQPLFPEKKYKKRRYAAHLRLILLNLLRAYRQNRLRFVAYSRNRNSYYPQKVGAQGLKVSYEPFGHIVNALEALGYIETKRGFHYAGISSSNARMRATEKLKVLFRPARSTFPDENCIVLKNADGERLPYTENSATRRMRTNLRSINDLLSSHFIGLYVPDTELAKINKKMRQKKRPPLDVSKTRLRRTFSRGSFDLGGRFYGAFWVQLLKEYRPFIRIHHEETEARDFTATILSLMYLEKGLPLPEGDLYLFPGTHPDDRNALKLAAQMLVNNPTRQDALKAINFEVIYRRPTRGNYTAEAILTAMEMKHRAIKDLFFRDQGVIYQRKESDLAEAIMLRFAEMGKPVLPIHDAFIVKKSDAALLEQIMTEVVAAQYGRSIPFKADSSSKLAFLPVENEREAYGEYYKSWEEWRLEHLADEHKSEGGESWQESNSARMAA